MPATTSTRSAVVTLPTDTSILVTREFNAPKAAVFAVYTQPEHVRRWWSGDRGTVTSAEVDLRVGGTWRYAMRANGGFDVAFHGEYLEIEPAVRLVFTEVFEGGPEGDPAVNTATFAEHDGHTTFTLRTEVTSRELRDMIIESGMEGGMQEGFDLLERIAVELA